MNKLLKKLAPVDKEQFAVFKMRKGETGVKEFYSWDYRYYNEQMLKEKHHMDNNPITEYFSLNHVVRDSLKIYEKLLEIRFLELANLSPEFPWHAYVKLYQVNDAQDGELLWCMYLDSFPQAGRHNHACCARINLGGSIGSSRRIYQHPVMAILASFNSPTLNRSSLLTHTEVVTLFHQLGHAMHRLCSKTTYSHFHETKAERNFVEAPSPMLKNWCCDNQLLKNISRNYI